MISYDEAVAMLPGTSIIHTFRNSGGMLFGADIPRERILALMKEHSATLDRSGPTAEGMKHGLVLIDETGPLFIRTRQANE